MFAHPLQYSFSYTNKLSQKQYFVRCRLHSLFTTKMIFSFFLVLAIFELRPVLMTNTATVISSVIYKKVQVTEDSFNKMTMNNFVDDAIESRRYGGFYLCYYYLSHEYLLANMILFSDCRT